MTSAAWDDLRAVLQETADLLNKQDPASILLLEERTRQLAREITADESKDARSTTVLVFALGAERYGWPVGNVRAIARIDRLTVVPSAPPYYAGVVSHRGRVLSVLDLRVYLGLPPLTSTPEFMIVIDGDGLEVGVMASDVFDVLNVPPGKMALASTAGLNGELITGVTPDGLTLLDAEALLHNERQRVESEESNR